MLQRILNQFQFKMCGLLMGFRYQYVSDDQQHANDDQARKRRPGTQTTTSSGESARCRFIDLFPKSNDDEY
jgi:hypothetical protein